MYCTQCGTTLTETAKFCSQCGTRTAAGPVSYPERRLMRSRTDKKIAGVCGGVARYFDVDPTFVRLLWLILVFFPLPGGLIAYIIAWIVLPKEPIYLPAANVPYATTAPAV